jgi:hypothetical protein
VERGTLIKWQDSVWWRKGERTRGREVLGGYGQNSTGLNGVMWGGVAEHFG